MTAIRVGDDFFETDNLLLGSKGCSELKRYLKEHWSVCEECRYMKRPHDLPLTSEDPATEVVDICAIASVFARTHVQVCSHCTKHSDHWPVPLLTVLAAYFRSTRMMPTENHAAKQFIAPDSHRALLSLIRDSRW